jgi:hypothetical protein
MCVQQGVGGAPTNQTSLATLFQQWAEGRGLTLEAVGCSAAGAVPSPSNWSGCFNTSTAIIAPVRACVRVCMTLDLRDWLARSLSLSLSLFLSLPTPRMRPRS